MDQQKLLEPIPADKLDFFTKEDLIILLRGEQSISLQYKKENERLRAFNEELKQKSLYVEEQFITLKK